MSKLLSRMLGWGLLAGFALAPGWRGMGFYWDWGLPYYAEDFQHLFTPFRYAWHEYQFGQPMSYHTDLFFRWAAQWLGYLPFTAERIVYGLHVGVLVLIAVCTSGILRKLGARPLLSWLLAAVTMVSPALTYKVAAGHIYYLIAFACWLGMLWLVTTWPTLRLQSALALGVLGGLATIQSQFLLFVPVTLLALVVTGRVQKPRWLWVSLAVGLLLNLPWMIGFLNGTVGAVAVNGRSLSQSFDALGTTSLGEIFQMTYSQATTLGMLMSPLFRGLAMLVSVLALFQLFQKSRAGAAMGRMVLAVVGVLIVLPMLWVGLPGGNLLRGLLREVGHLAPLIWFGVVCALATPRGKLATAVTCVAVVLFGIVGLRTFRRSLPVLSYADLRTGTQEIREQVSPEQRVLSFPLYEQRSYLGAQIAPAPLQPLANSGWDMGTKLLAPAWVSLLPSDALVGPTLLTSRAGAIWMQERGIDVLTDYSRTFGTSVQRYYPTTDGSELRYTPGLLAGIAANIPGSTLSANGMVLTLPKQEKVLGARSVVKRSPVEYQVEVETPGTVTFLSTYHPGWVLKQVDGSASERVETTWGNAWAAPRPGTYLLTFTPARTQTFFWNLAGLTLLLALGGTLTAFVRRRT